MAYRCAVHGGTPILDCPNCEPTRRWHAWVGWLRSLRTWNVFGTATFDQNKNPGGLSRDQANKRVKAWIRRCERIVGPLKVIASIEHTVHGWPHVHFLLAAERSLSHDEVQRLGFLWKHDNGIFNFQVPHGQDAVAAYVSKELATDRQADDLVIWPATGPLRQLRSGMRSVRNRRTR